MNVIAACMRATYLIKRARLGSIYCIYVAKKNKNLYISLIKYACMYQGQDYFNRIYNCSV